jgi:glycine/D-amino acid oxidase-like deaminating enzyme
VAAAARAGGTVSEGVRVTGLATSAGRLAADSVVLAAGTGSAELLDRLGLPQDLATKVIQVELCAAGVPAGHPAYVDDVHDLTGLPGPDPGTIHIGHPTGLWGTAGGGPELDPAHTARAVRAGAARFRWAAGCRPRGGVRAVEAYTASASTPVRPVPGLAGLVLAAGLGGGGIRLGPWAAAEVLRALAGAAVPSTEELCTAS